MKKVFSKEDIKTYLELTYECMNKAQGQILGDVDENTSETLNMDFEEDVVWSGNCFGTFYEQINVCRFGTKLLVELQKLGDYDGYYKDWSMRKYMETMYEVCEGIEDVYINNYEYHEDDPMFRAFFISFLFEIEDEFIFYEKVYKYCHDFCTSVENLAEGKLRGFYWNSEFEKDEMLFCKMYLTPFFKKLPFEQVIFNHGNKEFGKDYLLVSHNSFGEIEYYGVQAKAGDISGSAMSGIWEICNQIKTAFTVPYKLVDGRKVFISKIVIAISGKFTENAMEIIQNSLDRYMFTNTIFLSKKELENHYLMR